MQWVFVDTKGCYLQVCHVVLAACGCGSADIAGVGLVAAWGGSIG